MWEFALFHIAQYLSPIEVLALEIVNKDFERLLLKQSFAQLDSRIACCERDQQLCLELIHEGYLPSKKYENFGFVILKEFRVNGIVYMNEWIDWDHIPSEQDMRHYWWLYGVDSPKNLLAQLPGEKHLCLTCGWISGDMQTETQCVFCFQQIKEERQKTTQKTTNGRITTRSFTTSRRQSLFTKTNGGITGIIRNHRTKRKTNKRNHEKYVYVNDIDHSLFDCNHHLFTSPIT